MLHAVWDIGQYQANGQVKSHGARNVRRDCGHCRNGKTLRENGLGVGGRGKIVPISARFVVNKASFKFKNAEIEKMCNALRGALEEPV
jgi:hypothetical protein